VGNRGKASYLSRELSAGDSYHGRLTFKRR
jgi:hypothetical protein